jgi:hypothetical protein
VQLRLVGDAAAGEGRLWILSAAQPACWGCCYMHVR